jgi:prepilin-type N-terminal cleavage/methylation domain-containing protein
MNQKLEIRRAGFTLVEIMIVVGIITVLASIAIPNILRGRNRAQATQVLQDLRIIDAAIDQYAIETNKSPGAFVSWTDVTPYMKAGTRLAQSGGRDILGNTFSGEYRVDSDFAVLVAPQTFSALSTVAPAAFWSPYMPTVGP